MDGLAPVWPASRTSLNGVSLGDAWPCEVLKKEGGEESDAMCVSISFVVLALSHNLRERLG